MSNKIERNFLEINSLKELNNSIISSKEYLIQIVSPSNFQLNKFFYKNVGKKHRWIDRLVWSEKQWNDYASSKKVKTFVLKKGKDFAGYFELIIHSELQEVEIAYLGLLEEYHNQKLGSFLLSSAIKNSFLENPKRVWAHTCSLDHKNALNNYISRGMKIFKTEILKI